MNVDIDFPEVMKPLISEHHRYKIAHGGRGGLKSWSFARAILLIGADKPIRVLCARELQNSISDSVHKLLSDQITMMNLHAFYDIQTNRIIGKNGTEIGFQGIKHNANKLKSWEGCDICWVEEAQAVSAHSWETLIPTIRKDGSEIWISFNPELETDETYQRFVADPPKNSWVTKVGYEDNPWFPAVLEEERIELKKKDPDAYLNIWEGHCRQTLSGAVYQNEIRQTTEDNRICRVPYDKTKPVSTFFDLGWSDKTSIIFAQAVGFEYRIIDFMEDRHKDIQYYIAELNKRGYVYDIDWLPHDADSKTLQTGRSIRQIMAAAGRKVNIIPATKIETGINAARTIFPSCYFDEVKCKPLLDHLRRYRYDYNEDTGQYSKKPLHDDHSHASDAFRYLALSLKQKPKRQAARGKARNAGAWMS